MPYCCLRSLGDAALAQRTGWPRECRRASDNHADSVYQSNGVLVQKYQGQDLTTTDFFRKTLFPGPILSSTTTQPRARTTSTVSTHNRPQTYRSGRTAHYVSSRPPSTHPRSVVGEFRSWYITRGSLSPRGDNQDTISTIIKCIRLGVVNIAK